MLLELNSADIFSIRSDFDTEVYKTTQSLITALAALQQFDLSSSNRFIANMDVSLGIEGISVKELEESTEQLIYRGWITSIIRIWDIYRSEMAKHGLSEVVENQQIQQDVMGDLNKIRNAFTHGHNIVNENDNRVKNCKILKWFKPGEKLILTILHVFEFLHHFGLLTPLIIKIKKDSEANQSDFKLVWLIKKDAILHSVRRKIISLKDSGTTEGEPDQRSILILFDNGLFGEFNPRELNINSFQTVEITKGNLKFDNGTIIKSRDLYRYLVRKFPQGNYVSQEWGFKAKEPTELKPPETQLEAELSVAKIVEVDIQNGRNVPPSEI